MAPGDTTTGVSATPLARFRAAGAFRRPHAQLWRERGIAGVLLLCASVAVFSLGAIFLVLLMNSLEFFRFVSIVEFLTGTDWNANTAAGPFGVLPLVNGTLLVAVGSAVLAVPLGLATAIYLSEFATPRIRAVVKPALEVLAGIPSIAFGLFAVLVVSPLLQEWFNAEIFNAANAIVVLTFMVLPIVTSLSEDALRAVPRDMREGAFALGATRWEVSIRTVVPAALSGIVASILLGFSRAIGETMAVTLAAGSRDQMTPNIFESVETMTAFIAIKAQGDTVQQGPSYFSLYAVGLLLFVLTFLFNWLAGRFIRRYREAY